MKKDVLIAIEGEQMLDDTSDKIEFFTDGIMDFTKAKQTITYHETEMTGLGNTKTVVCVEGNKVVITRTGEIISQLILEKGKRHLCPYSTPNGDMLMGINTYNIDNGLTKDGGILSVSYDFELNHQLASENQLKMTVSHKPS